MSDRPLYLGPVPEDIDDRGQVVGHGLGGGRRVSSGHGFHDGPMLVEGIRRTARHQGQSVLVARGAISQVGDQLVGDGVVADPAQGGV